MPQYDHLPLRRLPERMPRRKRGFGRVPAREAGAHSRHLSGALESAISAQQRRRPSFIDPALILRIQVTGATMEEDWAQLGMTVLSHDEDRTLVLFSDSDQMAGFRQRLAAYDRGVPTGRKSRPHAGFINSIEAIGDVEPRDRIGARLRTSGISEPDEFVDDETYTLDIEFWEFGNRDARTRALEQTVAYVEAQDGEELDRHIGPNITLVRIACTGTVVRSLLQADRIQEIDLPPVPDMVSAATLRRGIDDFPQPTNQSEDLPLVGIIDSGVNDHPLIEDIVVGRIGVPNTLGTDDALGHGTRVAGIAAFGDLRGQIDGGSLTRVARLCAAKVVDATGRFPTRRLVPKIMDEAIRRLHDEFGCRIFVHALGDSRKLLESGKVGPWAQMLDDLARELDVLIIVSAGNRPPRAGPRVEEAVTGYPDYLTEGGNRLCEPGGAVNVLTVGALAHGHGLGPALAGHVGVRTITKLGEPSPFTRSGPGTKGSMKPDVSDYGGTCVYDNATARLHGGELREEAGMLSLHHDFVSQLLSSNSGTSFAAPLVAFKASQILNRFPDASANLLRALLAGNARVPDAATTRLGPLGQDASNAITGAGIVDLDKAAFSDDARAILFTEDELAPDHFAIYEIPIPREYQTTRGDRSLRVTLAYDPPTRHSRIDYPGLTMNFRVHRGCTADELFDHYRSRPRDENVPSIANRAKVDLSPGPNTRDKATLQTASKVFKRDISQHGDSYFLVVRCASGWSDSASAQRYALTVELAHEATIQLHARLRARLRV